MWRVMGESRAERLTAAQIAKKSFAETFAEWFLSGSTLIPVSFTKHAMWCRCRGLNHKMHRPRMSRTGAHTSASGVGKHKDGHYQVDYPVSQAIAATKVGEAACGKA